MVHDGFSSTPRHARLAVSKHGSSRAPTLPALSATFPHPSGKAGVFSTATPPHVSLGWNPSNYPTPSLIGLRPHCSSAIQLYHPSCASFCRCGTLPTWQRLMASETGTRIYARIIVVTALLLTRAVCLSSLNTTTSQRDWYSSDQAERLGPKPFRYQEKRQRACNWMMTKPQFRIVSTGARVQRSGRQGR